MIRSSWFEHFDCVEQLGDIVIFLDSQRKPIKESDRSPGRYPYYGANGQQGTINDYIFDEPLILLAEDGGHFWNENPISYIASGKYWVNNHAHVLKPKDGYDLNFINYQLAHYDVSRFVTGTTRGKLTKNSATNIPIYCPTLLEQQRIAKILDKADTIRKKRRQALQLANEFLKSTFLEMFGDPVINTKGWKTRPLGQLCHICRGSSPRPIDKYLGGSVPWIKIGDATQNDDIYMHSTKQHILETGVKKSRYLKAGSLIFANCGVSLGFARIIKFDGCIHDGWLSFSELSESIQPIFLLKLLNSITEFFRKTAPDGTQPNLNTQIMKEFSIILPPIQMQLDFIDIVEKHSRISEGLNKAANEAENLFNSLVQRAFKGELI